VCGGGGKEITRGLPPPSWERRSPRGRKGTRFYPILSLRGEAGPSWRRGPWGGRVRVTSYKPSKGNTAGRKERRDRQSPPVLVCGVQKFFEGVSGKSLGVREGEVALLKKKAVVEKPRKIPYQLAAERNSAKKNSSRASRKKNFWRGKKKGKIMYLHCL